MKNKDLNAEYRRKLKMWVILSVGTFFVYGGFLLLDVFLYSQDTYVAMITIIAGFPIILAAALVYFLIPRFQYIPLVIGVAANITFLFVGSYLEFIDYYFLFMLLVAGTITTVKNFRQILIFSVISTVINVLAMIFFIPYLEWLSGFNFLLTFALYFYGLLFLLLITYNVAQKEGHSERALDAFSSLLRSTPNLMVITNPEGKVIYLSDPMAKFIHYPRKEYAVGQPLIDLTADDELKIMFADMLDADGYYETIMELDVEGARRHFKIVADKLGGEADGFFIDIADITPSVIAQKTAEEANKSKTNFLATMSHEIRTPMNAIIGITQIQLQNSDLPGEYISALEKIYISGNSLLGIINDILDMSKIETGKLEMIPINYDIPSLINDSVQVNIVRIGSKAIELIIDINENLPSRFYGDELRLKQILNNLLSNAIKYTNEGYVKLSVTHSQLSDDDIDLHFTVEDTGQGMKPEDCERLFAEYTRFNFEANRTTEGTGIGMNITKNLVEMMNGTIDVKSEYGKGSIFSITVKQKAVKCEVIGPELSKQLRNFTFSGERQVTNMLVLRELMPYGKVLIVDDVETNLYVAEGLMAPYKINIETVASGFAALDKVQNGNSYDIIFMDHMMPQMDGIETTKKLRDIGYKDVIIALTANALTGNDEMFKSNGFDDFIAKPIDIHHLNAILNKYIRNRYPDEAKNYSTKNISEKSETVKLDKKLMQIFCRDAEKAIITLRETIKNNDITMFTTTAHAMKAALANVGENKASDMAFALEDAGLKGDAEYITANTESFVESLEAMIINFAPETAEAGSDTVVMDITEDTALLTEQMKIIKTACEDYDDTRANAALDLLMENPWKPETVALLNEIRDILFLHSDFEKAAELAGQIKTDICDT
ncbi:MAG: response regulator [Oscillospiraceae bacterium]|jgi:signal transduction histidine kinase/DNA-binding response OmpR family regulator|nr:response regulator [Oscillospiraceae bacterium]